MPELEEEVLEQDRASRPFWSGTITFGLVSIPVGLYPANRGARVSLRMLDQEGKPLARRYYAPATGKELDPSQMVRGYEISKEKFVVVSDEELDRLAPEKSRDIDLRLFVPRQDIPPLYFERGYFLAPQDSSVKAYRLLAATMEETGQAGIATFVMRGKEYLVAILSENGILRAEILRFADEIRSAREIGLPETRSAPAAKVKRFSQAIQKLSASSLSPKEMEDESAAGLLDLAKKKKAKGKNVVHIDAPEEDRGPAIDIVTILKNSLRQTASRKKTKTVSRARAR